MVQAHVHRQEAGRKGPRSTGGQEGEPGQSRRCTGRHPQAVSRGGAALERRQAEGPREPGIGSSPAAGPCSRGLTWYTVGRIQPLLLQRVQISATSQEA